VSEIFREIDEELRKENFAKLWQRYSPYIIGVVAVALVAAVVVWQWRQYEARERASEGERFQVALALLHDGKTKDAKTVFADLAQSGGERAVLARLELAALDAQAHDIAGAIATYDSIAADGSVDPAFRALATILGAQAQLANRVDPRQVIARLAPLAGSPGPWQPSAIELTGVAQLTAGDKKAAHRTFLGLANDPAAPQGLRQRAAEMVAIPAQ
jgi:hypothetical protein